MGGHQIFEECDNQRFPSAKVFSSPFFALLFHKIALEQKIYLDF